MSNCPHIITMMIGIPNSGKTTQVSELIRQDMVPTYNIFSLNRLRLEFAAKNKIIEPVPEHQEPSAEDYVTAFEYCSDNSEFNAFQKGVWYEMLEKAQNFQVPIYMDNMHLIARHRKAMIRDLQGMGLTVRGVYTEVSLGEAINRNAEAKGVPTRVIERAYADLEVPEGIEFDEFVHIDTEME